MVPAVISLRYFTTSLRDSALSIDTKQLVILLHGIARTARSMRSIEKALLQQGYLTLNVDYPSRHGSIKALADNVHQQVLTYPNIQQLTLHMVTHSMGALVARSLLAMPLFNNVQRVVMLGPPNQGSEVADFIMHYQPFKAFYGPALTNLSTHHAKTQPFPALPAHCQVGIIAGSINIDPICYFLLPRQNDGKVSLASTKIAGMTDHIELPTTHAFMMYNKGVIKQICHFIAHGYFLRSNTNTKDNQTK